MAAESFYFQGNDGKKLYAQKWQAEEEPRAIVQIAHGMAEHIGRYDDFAEFLLSHSIAVYGNDHRGHGRTEESHSDRGYYGDNITFDGIVDDMYKLTEAIQETHPGKPIFLLGHSMGSFLARRYVQLHSERVNGAILTGSGGNPGIAGVLGARIAAFEGKLRGRRKKSLLLNSLTFSAYNKAFRPNRTDFDWLSRDEAQVDAYIDDPLCGEVFTAGFFEEFLKGLNALYDGDQFIRKDLPVYFLSGDRDPVGRDTEGVKESCEKLKVQGLSEVECTFYEGARHEILNETNRKEVYADILVWLEKRLAPLQPAE